MKVHGVTWNIMAPVPEPIRYAGQKERMVRIAPALSTELAPLAPLDVVVFQESIIMSQHMLVRRGMQKLGFVHESKQLSGALRAMKVVQGGVVVFSKYPFEHQDHCVFEGLCDREDCYAAKGCVYVRFMKHDIPVHVFAVHLNAWESPQSRKVRRGQMNEVAQFMRQQGLGKDEPVLVLGDINVDYYSERRQLGALQQLVECELLNRHKDSHPFTSDPLTNMLVGMDDTSAYSSEAYPHGCYQEYHKYLQCICCPQEWLDHVMVSRRHAKCSLSESWVRAVALKVAPFEMHIGASMTRTVRDLSDHYPVVFCASFPELKCTEELWHPTADMGYPMELVVPNTESDTSDLVTWAVMTVLLVGVLWIVWWLMT